MHGCVFSQYAYKIRGNYEEPMKMVWGKCVFPNAIPPGGSTVGSGSAHGDRDGVPVDSLVIIDYRQGDDVFSQAKRDLRRNPSAIRRASAKRPLQDHP